MQHFGSIYAQREKVDDSVVSCKRTESAESVDKNKTQEPVVFLDDACFELNRGVHLYCQTACAGFMLIPL